MHKTNALGIRQEHFDFLFLPFPHFFSFCLELSQFSRQFFLIFSASSEKYHMLLIRKGKEGNAMLTTELFVAIVGICATFYTIGYAHGQRGAKTKK